MRWRVQAAIAIEIIGTNVVHVVAPSIDYGEFLSASEQAFSNGNFFMLLHCVAMWWYQGFTRDHLLERHVTRVALERPLSEVRAGEAVVALVETGPWTRRFDLRPGECPNGTVPLGQLMQLGALHVDEERGEVIDRSTLELLQDRDCLHIAAEELLTDEGAKERAMVGTRLGGSQLARALVGSYEPARMLQRDESETFTWLDNLHPVLQRPLTWRGSSAMRNFGLAALAMALGSVVAALPRGALPLPEFLQSRTPKATRAVWEEY